MQEMQEEEEEKIQGDNKKVERIRLLQAQTEAELQQYGQQILEGDEAGR